MLKAFNSPKVAPFLRCKLQFSFTILFSMAHSGLRLLLELEQRISFNCFSVKVYGIVKAWVWPSKSRCRIANPVTADGKSAHPLHRAQLGPF